nr:phage protease [Pseudomonas aeruginosa]
MARRLRPVGRVEYTARAAKLIEDGEYLYFSPVFSYAPDGTVLPSSWAQ